MILQSSSTCWSRGTALSRTTPRISFSSYPDSCLCSFYITGLNTSKREQLSGNGPQESLAAFIEWVLVSCQSKLTKDIVDVDASPTRDPEPSHSPPRSAELLPSGATELPIVLEPEPQVSDQVREPTVQAKVETAVEIVGLWNAPPTAPSLGVSIN